MGGQLEGEHLVPMLQFIQRLEGLAQLDLVLDKPDFGTLLPALRMPPKISKII